jgi:hypothetical protein
MSNITPKQMRDIIQKQSANLQQKNRMIKCLRSELQRLGKLNNLKRSWKNIRRLT